MSPTAHAEWTLVAESSDASVYLDYSTIKRFQGTVRVWELFDNPKGAKSPDGKLLYKSSKTLEEFDCSSDRSKTIQFLWYSSVMAMGEIVYKDVGNAYEWLEFPKGSINSKIKQKLCNL